MSGDVKIDESDDGIRLDRWFKRHRPDIPHSLLQKLLRKRTILLNGKKVEANQRIAVGDILQLPEVKVSERPSKYTPVIDKKDIDKVFENNILYENADVMVINKSAGLPTQGGSKVRVSVDAVIKHMNKMNDTQLRLVHRLDKDTSGVLVLAKNAKAATEMGKAFKAQTIEKTYWAIVVGVPLKREGVINIPIMAKKKQGSIEKAAVDDEGKVAITEYRVVDKASKKLAWVELKPKTGRMHQLRVHMLEIDNPVLGDGKYGGADAFIEGLGKELHLHAREIILPNGMSVTAPLPPHMQKTWDLMEFGD